MLAFNRTDLERLFSEPIWLKAENLVGDGAVVDEQFNTTDVCIVLPTDHLSEKYTKHYERITKKIIPLKSGTR